MKHIVSGIQPTGELIWALVTFSILNYPIILFGAKERNSEHQTSLVVCLL